MANTDYKPICASGSGGECAWVITTSDKLPKTGVQGKVYLCLDNGKYFGWLDGKYQEVGTGGSGPQYKYPEGRASFPTIGVEGKVYVDKLTGAKYIWDPNIGYPTYRLPNWVGGDSNIGAASPNQILPFVQRLNYGTGTDAKGNFVYGTLTTAHSPQAFNLECCLNFLDPTGGRQIIKEMRIVPTVCYYDPDNPIIDVGQLPTPYDDTFAIFFPKSHDIKKWTDTAIVSLMRQGEYNYAFYLTNKSKGSYVQVE